MKIKLCNYCALLVKYNITYDLGCIKFGRLGGVKVNKVMFMLILICAIKLQSNHSKEVEIGTVLTL